MTVIGFLLWNSLVLIEKITLQVGFEPRHRSFLFFCNFGIYLEEILCVCWEGGGGGGGGGWHASLMRYEKLCMDKKDPTMLT